VVRERENLVGMATLKLEQTRDDVRLKVEKAFRDWATSQETLKINEEMVGLRKEAEKKATTPEAMTNPAALDALLTASKKRAEAEVEAVKADLAYRQAYVDPTHCKPSQRRTASPISANWLDGRSPYLRINLTWGIVTTCWASNTPPPWKNFADAATSNRVPCTLVVCGTKVTRVQSCGSVGTLGLHVGRLGDASINQQMS
jgi:Outer membrane efflux protein